MINLQDFTNFESFSSEGNHVFKMKELTEEQRDVINIIWLLSRKLLTPAIKIYFSRNALIHVFFLYTVNLDALVD